MNVIFLVIAITIAFFLIQKNTKFAKTYPLNSAPRGDNGQIVSGFRNILDLETKSDKKKINYNYSKIFLNQIKLF